MSTAHPRPDFGRLGFSDEQADILDMATRFCRDRSPVSKVRALLTDELGHDRAIWREIVDMGWLGVAVPEAYGGAGLSPAELVPIVEQMGRRLMGGPFLSTQLAAQAILAGGTEAQKAALLPSIVGGAAATVALAEDDGYWDLARIGLQATRAGDRIRLAGAKILVADAAEAEWVIVSAILAGSPALIAVPKSDLPREKLRREVIIDETRRSFAIDFTGVETSADNLLDPAKAPAALAHLHLAANLLLAADMVGGSQAVIETTLDYLKTRKQFGKLIGSYQALKHPIVEAYTRWEHSRSHLYAAAHSFDRQGTGEIAVRMAKASADATYSYAADRAIQFHGGFGFTYDCDAQLYRRRAIWCASQQGDAVWHKRKLAALLL